jgi:hypothetical protein
MRPPVHIWINEAKPARGRKVFVYSSKQHLIAELKHDVGEGMRCFVASNAKSTAETIVSALRAEFPGRRTILVTSGTVSTSEVKDFLADPKRKALEYDVIVTSPSLGTGVDLTFEGNEPLVDCTYGFFEPLITTHFDVDQQMARVRNPGREKVYMSNRRFNFETNAEVVKRDLLDQSLYKNLLIGFDSGRPVYIEGDPFIEMAALITSQQRASKNSLKANFIRHRQAQGYEVVHVTPDPTLSPVGKTLLALGKHLRDEQYVANLLNAPALRRQEYEQVQEVIEASEVVTEQRAYSYARTGIELYYRRPLTEALIKLDDRGRMRRRVEVFGFAIAYPDLMNHILNAQEALNSGSSLSPPGQRLLMSSYAC